MADTMDPAVPLTVVTTPAHDAARALPLASPTDPSAPASSSASAASASSSVSIGPVPVAGADVVENVLLSPSAAADSLMKSPMASPASYTIEPTDTSLPGGKDDPYDRKVDHDAEKERKKKPTRSLVVPLLHIKDTERRLVLGMVGLPARGKTYIGKKITRYLSWLGYKTRVFNVGDYRRKIAGADQKSDFFDPDNKEGSRIRDECALLALKDLVAWFAQGGQAAIYDATNTTRMRRKVVSDFLKESPYTGELVWVESICNDPSLIEANIRDTKLFSPDYVGKDPELATQDFLRRIRNYERTYEPVDDGELAPEDAYVKLIDTGRKVVTNGIRGYLPGRIVFFLMNLQINKKPIWITRHGESQFNVMGKIGGDSDLSPLGQEYARALGEWISKVPELKDTTIINASTPTSASSSPLGTPAAGAAGAPGASTPSSSGGLLPSTTERRSSLVSASSASMRAAVAAASTSGTDITVLPLPTQTPRNPAYLPKVGSFGDVQGLDDTRKLSIWCSVLQRTIRTAGEVKRRNEDKVVGKVVEWRGLTEIDAGVYDGLTYEQIEAKDPVGFAERNTDKLRYRYPQGESYVDVIERLEAVIFELERAKGPVLVVGHQAVLRCLYGYFLDTPLDEIPFLDIPLHTVIKLIPKAYGCVEERHTLMRHSGSHGGKTAATSTPEVRGHAQRKDAGLV